MGQEAPKDQQATPRVHHKAGKKALTEQMAAFSFVRFMLEEAQNAWPIIHSQFKQTYSEKFAVADEEIASFDLYLAAVSLNLEPLKNLFPAQQADRLEKWVLKCVGGTPQWGNYAVDEINSYRTAFQEEKRVDVPLSAVPGRLLHRWLGERIKNFETEINGQKTGFIDVFLMTMTMASLAEFAGAWSWRKINDNFCLTEGDMPLDGQSASPTPAEKPLPEITEEVTGLYNARHLSFLLDTEVYRCARHGFQFSLLAITLGGQRELEDSVGRIQVHRLLAEVVPTIKAGCRLIDSAFHLGGGKFLVLLPNTSKQRATEIARDLRESVAVTAWLMVQGHEVRLNGTAGVVTWPEDGRTKGELLHSLDEAIGLTSRRILVVHHERLMAELICKLLLQEGYETRRECSSADAIGMASEFAPHLLIIDPVMPAISGLDAARQISIRTKCKVLFVNPGVRESAFTGFLDDLRNHGCDCEALPTPFESEELIECVRSLVGLSLATRRLS
jgi:diguanylate cyclase (GGDEF)-like protein